MFKAQKPFSKKALIVVVDFLWICIVGKKWDAAQQYKDIYHLDIATWAQMMVKCGKVIKKSWWVLSVNNFDLVQPT